MRDAGTDELRLGPAGRVARAFLESKLTPLALIGAVLLGAVAILKLPREEEPQIVVPMIDVTVNMPGASALEVERRVTSPLERRLREIPGVEYLYSTSSPGSALLVVRFEVGHDQADAVVQLNEKLQSIADSRPPGVSAPLIQLRAVDDVPVLALTLWSRRYGAYELRRVAAEMEQAIKQVPEVNRVSLIGGPRRQLRVLLDPERLASRGLRPLEVAAALQGANLRQPSGAIARNDREVLFEAGHQLRGPRDVERVVLGALEGSPVYLRDVARVEDGEEEPLSYVQHGAGAARTQGPAAEARGAFWPAVTVAVAKTKGSNAITVIDRVLARVESLRGSVIPSEVELTVTRNYGETARDKSNELLFHMALAVLGVSLLIWLVLGWREAVVVLLAIPATLALTLAVFYFLGYTLNRITLFALIFSIGILVDDAIVVIENIARHCRLPESRGLSGRQIALRAVDEVGNPTILATMTVIAAILPMAFVGGMMGPYMRPIPVGATAAMLFSLLIAFAVTPWATRRILGCGHRESGEKPEGRTTRWYRRGMSWLLDRPWRRRAFLAGVAVALLLSLVLLALGWVRVKMLPFDNKSELQIMVDLAEGESLERTAAVTRSLAEIVRREPEVTDLQLYVGTSAPFSFNGLVRHYYLRAAPHLADLQVNLSSRHDRSLQSHSIAKRIREALAPTARRLGARIKVVEVPPGPPVQQTLVTEIYGPELDRRIEIAARVRAMMEQLDGVVDVDWEVEERQPKVELTTDGERAALAGISEAELSRTAQLLLGGLRVGLLHDPREREDVPLVLRLDRETRSDLRRLRHLQLRGSGGQLVPLSELVQLRELRSDRSIYHKNLLPVTYVTAELAGRIESPVYAILKLAPEVSRLQLPEGYALSQRTASLPYESDRYALKWDGEWQITYEVFRDLGFAFALVMVLIYVLVVAWFQSFWVPLIIMSVIPVSLVGILPAHALLGAFFTATSMIGFIAGAGIVVRNSIILVDFIEQRRREGMPLAQAVVDAGAVRFRPMLLTAAAVVVGASVILFDPIFQGLAIALMAGELASLLLSRISVPVIYYIYRRRERGTEDAPG